METLHTVLSIAANHKWKLYQMDVRSMFLNGVLKGEVYVAQPPGYEVEGQEYNVYRLRKTLYGLKQATRAWYSKIATNLLDNCFDKCDGEPTLYIKESDAPTPTFMGLKLNKEDCSNNVNPTLFKSMVDILMYLIGTRSDLMYVVSLVLRLMEIPKDTHWKEAKRILKYVNETKEYGIFYIATKDFRVVGYTNNDWAGSVNDRKSTLGYAFHLSSGAIHGSPRSNR
eukprot:PITA_16785